MALQALPVLSSVVPLMLFRALTHGTLVWHT